MSKQTNILSVDLEDWFQVENYSSIIPREKWHRCESRVNKNVIRLLDIFARFEVRATFFVLGWIAERFPDLIRRIANAEHEIASHGWSHVPLWRLTPEKFAREVNRSRELLNNLTGQHIGGYRAPTFSITSKTIWGLRILAQAGYEYDSSIFPVHHDRYGIPDAPLGIHWRKEGIWEVPPSVFESAGIRLPVAGGGYFRLYPRWLTSKAIKKMNAENRPAVVYLHPWEFDPGQPKIKGIGFLANLRHHVGISRNFEKLSWLLGKFSFAPAREVLASRVGENWKSAASGASNINSFRSLNN